MQMCVTNTGGAYFIEKHDKEFKRTLVYSSLQQNAERLFQQNNRSLNGREGGITLLPCSIAAADLSPKNMPPACFLNGETHFGFKSLLLLF